MYDEWGTEVSGGCLTPGIRTACLRVVFSKQTSFDKRRSNGFVTNLVLFVNFFANGLLTTCAPVVFGPQGVHRRRSSPFLPNSLLPTTLRYPSSSPTPCPSTRWKLSSSVRSQRVGHRYFPTPGYRTTKVLFEIQTEKHIVGDQKSRPLLKS